MAKCPITRQQFEDDAEPIEVIIAGKNYTLQPREFSSGSFGWGFNVKSMVQINGVSVQIQVGLNVVVVGSSGVD